MSTLALTLAPPRSRAAARVLYQVGCAVGGSLLVAGLAQISFRLPFTPVPITGQTLGVLLVGAAYGPALGAATLVLYLVWGLIGLPVFAPMFKLLVAAGLLPVAWRLLQRLRPEGPGDAH